MSRFAFAALVVLTGAACAPQYPEYATDYQARQRIFKECMAALPEGPKATRYNDWAEVVQECDSVAYRQSQVCVEYCPQFPAAPTQQNGSGE